jgi:hypothetical protein
MTACWWSVTAKLLFTLIYPAMKCESRFLQCHNLCRIQLLRNPTVASARIPLSATVSWHDINETGYLPRAQG